MTVVEATLSEQEPLPPVAPCEKTPKPLKLPKASDSMQSHRLLSLLSPLLVPMCTTQARVSSACSCTGSRWSSDCVGRRTGSAPTGRGCCPPSGSCSTRSRTCPSTARSTPRKPRSRWHVGFCWSDDWSGSESSCDHGRTCVRKWHARQVGRQ